MISSPTEKGVVIIGGWKKSVTCNEFNKSEHSSDLLELSGDLIESLEWKLLKQKLQYQRSHHVSFSISNDIAATLTTNSIGSSVQNKAK